MIFFIPPKLFIFSIIFVESNRLFLFVQNTTIIPTQNLTRKSSSINNSQISSVFLLQSQCVFPFFSLRKNPTVLVLFRSSCILCSFLWEWKWIQSARRILGISTRFRFVSLKNRFSVCSARSSCSMNWRLSCGSVFWFRFVWFTRTQTFQSAIEKLARVSTDDGNAVGNGGFDADGWPKIKMRWLALREWQIVVIMEANWKGLFGLNCWCQADGFCRIEIEYFKRR